MDNRKHIEEFNKYETRIKELFKEVVSEEFYEIWGDTFEIDDIGKKEITLSYYGFQDVKEFKKECKKILESCVYSVTLDKKKIKIAKPQKVKHSKPKMKKSFLAAKFFIIGMIFICIATSVIAVMCNYIVNRNFRETFYNVSSIKVDSNVRIVQLSDLHSSTYGKNNQRLLERVEALAPDIIICTGDIVDSAKDDINYAFKIGHGLSKIAPTYYVYGNNEVETIYDIPLNEKELDKKFGFNKNNRDESKLREIKDAFEEKIEKTGVKVLKNEKDTVKIKTMNVDVYGVLNSNPSSFWSYSGNAFTEYITENKENLKIFAVHEPFVLQEFQIDFWGDLMVCGHTHGGLMHIPVLGPLFTHEGGLFPERNGDFVYGRYVTGGKPLIVSSGLENSSVFRLNNQPELVVIDINKF